MSEETTDGRRLRYAHRRGEILTAATEHALDNGLDGLTLRGIADSVGVSHATLVHHFGTRDALIAEIVQHVLTEALSAPAPVADGDDPLRALWTRATDPMGRRHVRLFAAITGSSLYGQTPLAEAVTHSMRDRTALLARAIEAGGCPASEAEARATLILGVTRGLIVDLLVTDDHDRVEAAFTAFAASLRCAPL
ncbi:TetR/AcrR family transcriptional regulator [Clavibacter sp. VKM Ac-2873]|uniref:TetR/AcrR family transcriptional regulator n=1 Tax=Clavibacter sp. VKM Ac-2873 TaxID=2783813 RepID=UPI00188A0965|nr:TetR/AcrR family transcriptional regulator [Clavibacter sp. VKM Ac-2873]MBF4619483.1 TetR/AcrR family transcriptional regulator [Clavibacter sp. VKM Ac-2873]